MQYVAIILFHNYADLQYLTFYRDQRQVDAFVPLIALTSSSCSLNTSTKRRGLFPLWVARGLLKTIAMQLWR